MSKTELLLQRCIAKITALNDVGGSSAVRLANQLAPKGSADAVTPKDVAKALEKGVRSGAVVQVGSKFHVAGRAPPAPPAVLIEDLSVGSGAEVAEGQSLTMAYEGTLLDGTRFDAASKFTFELGAGEVIKGWDKGVLGMRVGGKRKLTVPAELAYGKRGSPPEIGPDATLVFVVTLHSAK
jgi:FKBP-type peptidyl-prolyl cis-trans isomerase